MTRVSALLEHVGPRQRVRSFHRNCALVSTIGHKVCMISRPSQEQLTPSPPSGAVAGAAETALQVAGRDYGD